MKPPAPSNDNHPDFPDRDFFVELAKRLAREAAKRDAARLLKNSSV